jgi:copper chaperone CopZ
MVAAGLGGPAAVCFWCDAAVPAAALRASEVGVANDTATIRLHISGMTCGSCAATARLALKRLGGVFDATVTYQDSLGVVRYDSKVVTPAEIVAHLAKLTGYRVTVLSDAPKREGGRR